jgi:hypothetical protein
MLIGCEAFIKKFRRKPKKRRMQNIEVVLSPQEYPSLFQTKEDQYRQYFLYCKSWQDEFIISLGQYGSHKRQVYCLNEAIKNLYFINDMLSPEKQKELSVYVKELKRMKEELDRDIYSSNKYIYKTKAEKIKRNFLRNFSYPKVSEYIK